MSEICVFKRSFDLFDFFFAKFRILFEQNTGISSAFFVLIPVKRLAQNNP